MRVNTTKRRLPMTLVQYLMSKNISEDDTKDLSIYPTVPELTAEIRLKMVDDRKKRAMDKLRSIMDAAMIVLTKFDDLVRSKYNGEKQNVYDLIDYRKVVVADLKVFVQYKYRPCDESIPTIKSELVVRWMATKDRSDVSLKKYFLLVESDEAIVNLLLASTA